MEDAEFVLIILYVQPWEGRGEERLCSYGTLLFSDGRKYADFFSGNGNGNGSRVLGRPAKCVELACLLMFDCKWMEVVVNCWV